MRLLSMVYLSMSLLFCIVLFMVAVVVYAVDSGIVAIYCMRIPDIRDVYNVVDVVANHGIVTLRVATFLMALHCFYCRRRYFVVVICANIVHAVVGLCCCLCVRSVVHVCVYGVDGFVAFRRFVIIVFLYYHDAIVYIVDVCVCVDGDDVDDVVVICVATVAVTDIVECCVCVNVAGGYFVVVIYVVVVPVVCYTFVAVTMYAVACECFVVYVRYDASNCYVAVVVVVCVYDVVCVNIVDDDGAGCSYAGTCVTYMYVVYLVVVVVFIIVVYVVYMYACCMFISLLSCTLFSGVLFVVTL